MQKLLQENNIQGIKVLDGIESINFIGEQWLIKYHDGAVWLMNPLHKSVPFIKLMIAQIKSTLRAQTYC